jgi:hypothetical protein
MKLCSSCKLYKEVTYRLDKTTYRCRECNTKFAAKYRRSPKGKLKVFAAVYRSIKKYPQKQAARQTLKRELRKGNVAKLPCHCGATTVEAHHTDYLKPLAVIWLCRPHHADLERAV